MAYTVPWRCQQCGATGTVQFSLPGDLHTRKRRLETLLTLTLEQHPQCGIINLYWTFPTGWHEDNIPYE